MLSELFVLFDKLKEKIKGDVDIMIESRNKGIRVTVIWCNGMSYYQQYDVTEFETARTDELLFNDLVGKANAQFDAAERQRVYSS